MSRIIDATDRFRAQDRGIVVEHYQCLLLPADVTIGDLLHALRGSDLVACNEGACIVIYRRPRPDGAA